MIIKHKLLKVIVDQYVQLEIENYNFNLIIVSLQRKLITYIF